MKLPNVPLSINVSSRGICHLGADGATGKTYVTQLLKMQNGFTPGMSLILTYEQDMSDSIYISRILDFRGNIIFVDRADLYMSDGIREALSAKSNCLRFVDMKNFLWWNKVDTVLCDLEMFPDGSVNIEEFI